MYWLDIFRFIDSNEIEIKYAGRYGARGERRAPRTKITPEQIARQNQKNRVKRMRRIIKANFEAGDHWVTLKYPAGTRKGIEEVRKDLRLFIQRLRRAYKKKDEELKFIYRIEIGAQGGIHIHMVLNRSRGDPASDLMIQKAWKEGRVNFQSLYEDGSFIKLAEYITKEPTEEVNHQMCLFCEEDKAELIKYSTSRNLIRPVPERKIYRRRTVRKILQEGPTPSKGYYIDQSSIVQGVNPFTGCSYLQYTEIKIKDGPPGKKGRKEDV